LLGRAYNLGCGAYNLTIFGLYDEALSLIRSLGEIAGRLRVTHFYSDILMPLRTDRSRAPTAAEFFQARKEH